MNLPKRKGYMTFAGINYILYISTNAETIEILNRISKRLSVLKIKCCSRANQALAELEGSDLPDLIIEDLDIIDSDNLFPTIQENRPKHNFVPVPVFALFLPLNQSDIKIIEKANYIGYILKPLNESLIEQKIREIYHESYSYDKANVLHEIIEQHITKNNIQAAYQHLLPALCRKPKNLNYHILHAKILFERRKYFIAEKILNFVLQEDPNNLSAKNILTKILIITERYQEGQDL